MNHTRFGPMISAYMDGELTAEERVELLAHVRECDECAALLAEYQRLRVDLRDLPRPAPPPTLTDTIRRRASSSAAASRLSWGGLACSLTGLLMAAFGALTGFLAAHVWRWRGQPH